MLQFLFKSYYIDKEICYLTMCDESFLRRTAFSYLEEIASQFYAEYGNKIHTVARPYSFIEFGNFLLDYKLYHWFEKAIFYDNTKTFY